MDTWSSFTSSSCLQAPGGGAALSRTGSISKLLIKNHCYLSFSPEKLWLKFSVHVCVHMCGHVHMCERMSDVCMYVSAGTPMPADHTLVVKFAASSCTH